MLVCCGGFNCTPGGLVTSHSMRVLYTQPKMPGSGCLVVLSLITGTIERGRGVLMVASMEEERTCALICVTRVGTF